MLPLALIMSGLSVLPKIPEMWETVASIFGKEAPKSVKQAGELVNTIVSGIKSGEVPQEKQFELQIAMLQHEERIEEEKTKRQDMELKELQHQRDTHVALWANEQQSSSIKVQETRPTILRQMWGFVMFYGVFAPLLAIDAMFLLPISQATLIIGILKEFGFWLLGTFTTAFVGYTTARSLDKRNPELKNGNGIVAKTLNKIV
uniref:Holin n=1 Tax=viral metagenome TaxID=1070528 RepID=A0A6M3K022_9ZZZZ